MFYLALVVYFAVLTSANLLNQRYPNTGWSINLLLGFDYSMWLFCILLYFVSLGIAFFLSKVYCSWRKGSGTGQVAEEDEVVPLWFRKAGGSYHIFDCIVAGVSFGLALAMIWSNRAISWFIFLCLAATIAAFYSMWQKE